MKPDRIDLKDGKVTHEILQDAWKIAYDATGTPSRRPGAMTIEQMLWMVATATQAVAHVLVDVRESIDASVKQNENLLRVMSTVLRNQVIQIKQHDEQFRDWVRQLSECCEQICLCLKDA